MLQKRARGPNPLVRLHASLVALVLVIACAGSLVRAQTPDMLAQQWADSRVAQEQLNFLLKDQQITAAEYQSRGQQLAAQIQNLRVLIGKQPRDIQTALLQQSESLFQVRIVPLRQQWQQQLVEKQQQDTARDDQRRKELATDADLAGKLQAARTLLAEKAQRGEISQAELAQNDKTAEQEVLTLQHKYDAYGANWGALFSQTVAGVAQKVVTDTRVKLRLNDTQSEIGQDAHRAADLTLSMQRNAIFRAKQAMTPQQEVEQDNAAKAQIAAIQTKYQGRSPAAVDFQDRLARLVQTGATDQKAQWETDADQARTARLAPSRPTALPPPVRTQNPPLTTQNQASRPYSQPGNRPTVTPPTNLPPRRPTQNNSPLLPGFVPIVLLVAAAGAAGYFFLSARSHSAAASPSYTDLRNSTSASSQAGTQANPPERSASGSSVTMPVLPPTATLRERLFAEQKAKYQAGYNDRVDEVTSLTAEITALSNVPKGIENNLKLLSKALEERVKALLAAQTASPVKIVLNAAIFMPVWRFFSRSKLLLKIVVIVFLISLVREALLLFLTQQFSALLGMYLIFFAIFLFTERHFQLKTPLKALHGNADNFKPMVLARLYENQTAQVLDGVLAYRAIRVTSPHDQGAPIEEYMTKTAVEDPGIGPGTFLLVVGKLQRYRMDAKGASAISPGPGPANDFMKNYGTLLTQAVSEQTAFAAGTLPPLADYGQLMWRKRQVSDDLPGLQRLVQNVTRLESLWGNTYVSDKVFEFLLRRIDLFNVRDSATPSGILLYGYAGNGKAHLAKVIADSVSARFESVDAAVLASPEAVKALWDRNRGKDPVVLFVDNAENVFPRPGSENQGAGTREGTLAWLAEWSKAPSRLSHVWVVITASSDKELHPSIIAQIGGSKIEVTSPDVAGRALVLQKACRENQLPTELPAWLVAATGGCSVRELCDVVKETKLQCVPNAPTDIHWREAVKSVRSSDAEFRDESKTWERLVLPPAIKDQLQRACKILQDADRYKEKGINVPNILLFGPPGTGKTDIARTFANEGGVKFFLATTADMKAQYVGQSAHLVRDVFAKARSGAPAVLFIDEIETVAAKRGSPNADSFTQDVVTEMLAQMDGARKYDRPVFVLAATNLPDQIDSAILSRFTSKIAIPLPDADGRRLMLKNLIGERAAEHAVDPALDINAVSDELAKRLDGKSGRDLVMLVNRAMERAVLSESADNVCLTREFLLAELATQDSDREAVDETARWDSLVLADDTIEKLKTVCEMLRNIEVLQKQGITPPRAALLYGPPGTGKTQIARTLSNESGLPFISAGPADIKAGYIGQSGQKVKELFARAREKAPCILFIDEIESGAASRNSPKADQFTGEIVTQLLTELDGVKKNTKHIFLLAATNHPEMIDDAIRSRFVEKIEIPNPDEKQRQRLFEIQLAKKQVDFDVPQLSADLAHRSASMSGRDIFSLVDKASQHALSRALKAGTTDHVVLSREDLLFQFAPQGKEISEADLQKIWSQIVLKPEIKELILTKIRMFNSGKSAPRGLLLYGPPGTGKTEIARLIAKSATCQFKSLQSSDLKAGYVGQSAQAVKKIWEEARAYGRCVIFIDECDAVFGRRGSVNTDSGTEEVVPEFLASWDGVASQGQIWVIGATNQRQRLDEAIISRFGAGSAIEIGLPEAPERMEILRLEMQKNEMPPDIPDFVARATTGLAGRDLSQVVRDVCTTVAEHNTAITPEIWKDVIARYVKAGSESVDESAGWDSLVLADSTIDTLQTICESLRQIEVLKKQGIQPPRGALLYGPPGTGKTQIARTIANESGLPFIAAGPSDIKAGYIGQSGQKVHELFERARSKAPCILFIDEIDSGASRRGSAQADQFNNEIVTQMLTELDGVAKNDRPVFLLAATNHPELVDEAILSRFVEKIEIPNPDADQRRRLFQILLAKKRVDFDVAQISETLARQTGEISGRGIYSLIERAAQSALHRALKTGHADQVILTQEDLLGQLSPAQRPPAASSPGSALGGQTLAD